MNHKSLAYGNVDLGSKLIKHKTRSLNSFEGQMQQLIINGKSFFELIDNGDMANSVNRTVTFLRADLPHKFPLTFHTNQSWVALPKIDAFHILLIQFHVKTALANGLILYNNGQNSDFLAVELVDGQINYVFSLGKVVNRIKSRSKERLNDNKWHLVSIWRSTKSNHELSVDSILYRHTTKSNENLQFNLIDFLYVGGLRNQTEYETLNEKSRIMSRHGFKGCLASFEINGRVPDFDDVLNVNGKMNGNITKGCESPFDCQTNTCKYGGFCIEKWEENEKLCDCDMTTFTGKFCELSKQFSFVILRPL